MLVEEEVKDFYELMAKLGKFTIKWVSGGKIILPKRPEDLESLKKALEIVEMVKGTKIEETVYCEALKGGPIYVEKSGIWIPKDVVEKTLRRKAEQRERLSLEEVEKILRRLERWWSSGKTGELIRRALEEKMIFSNGKGFWWSGEHSLDHENILKFLELIRELGLEKCFRYFATWYWKIKGNEIYVHANKDLLDLEDGTPLTFNEALFLADY